jgi:hypothetical protein
VQDIGAFGDALISANTVELNGTYTDITDKMFKISGDIAWYFEHLNKY